MKLEGFPQNVVLRDGVAVVIKPLDVEEASAVLKFYRSLPEEDRLFLRDDVTKPEWLRRFVARIESGEVVSLVAESDGKIVGEATLYRALHGWTVHVAELRVAVAPPMRRNGLGTALARELVRLATRMGIEKMIIQVVENQVGARKMFRKLGFWKTFGFHMMIGGTPVCLLINPFYWLMAIFWVVFPFRLIPAVSISR